MTRGEAPVASPHRSPARCTGVILAGGASARFGGTPKGLAPLAGERMLDHVARALATATDALLIASNDPQAHAWLHATPAVADLQGEQGPLAGIHAALVRAHSSLLVVAWDMPFVPASLLRELRVLGEHGTHDAVLPVDADGRLEPLCAWYSVALLPTLEALLASGERRAGALADAVRARTLTTEEIAEHGDPGWLLANVNTRDELERAEVRLRRE